MLQVKAFNLPVEQKEANEFLSEHKTTQINFHEGMMVVLYEQGGYPLAYMLTDLEELLQSSKAAKFQQEVAFEVMKYERDGAGYVSEKRKQELTHGMNSVHEAIKIQDVKIDFVTKKLDELRARK